MNEKDLYKSFEALDDDTLLKSETSVKKRKKLAGWLSATAACLVLAGAAIVAAGVIGRGGADAREQTAGNTEAAVTEQVTSANIAPDFGELYKNAEIESDKGDRAVFENGLESWLAFHDDRDHTYSAVLGEVVSTRYFLYWNNDQEDGLRLVDWGIQLSEIRLVSVPEELNKLGLEPGATVYAFDSVYLSPDENDALALFGRKSGVQVDSIDELAEVDSFLFEILPEDLADFAFTPIFHSNVLPKETGKSYYLLLTEDAGGAERMKDFCDTLYYCSISMPADESYAALHERTGFTFDSDIRLVAEELKRYFD